MDHLESYINATDIEYDSEDVTFTGYVYLLKTLQFKFFERNAYGKGTNYMKGIGEFRGQNCYIPTSGMCFIKCVIDFSKKDYTEEFRDFNRDEKQRSRVLNSARIQPFCKKYEINIGCFDGKRVNPQKITQRNTSLFIHNNSFCFIGKSNSISFIQAKKDESKQKL